MGRNRRNRGRDVTGILLLDKPEGAGSNAVLQHCKRLFDARKAGHTGSLDVPASGLLPICFGEATKVSGFLLDATKRYLATFRLGMRTSTGDAKGETLETCVVGDLHEARVREVLARFTGDIEQIPPMHSAIKRGGVPLYKLAYEGKTIEREPRPVTIYAMELLGIHDECIDVDVTCSKGTYIRALAEDVGAALGCGGHVSALRRTAAGPYSIEQAWTPTALEALAAEGTAALDACLLPVDSALGDMPAVALSPDSVFYLRQGQAVQVPRAPTSGLLRLYEPGERLLGVGEILDDGRVALKRQIRS